MSRDNTQELIKKLEELRESTIISMIYSKNAEMNEEDIEILYDVLIKTLGSRSKELERIELILHSIGGDANAAYSLVRLLRRHAKEFNVLIPREAKSAATLVALGSDKIYLSEIAELGPIDPIVSHPIMPRLLIPARAVQIFLEEVLPTLIERYRSEVTEYFLKIDYTHVGFCRSAIEVSREYAKRLLCQYHLKTKKGNLEEEANRIINDLISYPAHDFVIDYEEAKRLGLNVELLDEEEEKVLWNLYQEYMRKLNTTVLIVESSKYSRSITRPKFTIW